MKPTNLTELCQRLLEAQSSLEGEFSGDFEESGRYLRELRLHLEATFGVSLAPACMENPLNHEARP